MVSTDLNPRIIVKEIEGGLNLTFYGISLGNTEGIETAKSEVDFARALPEVESCTGAVRVEFPEEKGTRLVNVTRQAVPQLVA